MTIKPEDVRKHLEAKQAGAEIAVAAAGAALAAGAAAIVAAEKNAIVKNISMSYFLLRRGLAMLAFALPILLWLWAGPDHLQGSISAYYHYAAGDLRYGAGTSRDILVGILWAAGAFLFFYKGYSREENIALDVAGVAAVCLALFPMDWPPSDTAQPSLVSIVHSVSAVLLFLAMAYVCLCQSGPTLRLMRDPARQRRFKAIYKLLGTLMIVLPLTVVTLHYLLPSPTGSSSLTFSVEVAGIYVFSAFWLVKSREIAILERQ